MSDARYESFMGLGPKRIAHWEHWSNPDAETFITGIDYYAHPRQCRLKMKELYPQLRLSVPESDAPKPRPEDDPERHTVRWGADQTGTWQHGEAFFKSPEEVFAFSPVAKGDFRDWPHVVVNWDFSSEDALYRALRKDFPQEWGDQAPAGSSRMVSIYNTMFMWPLLAFGWELFLECCLDARFERVMDEFAQLNRRAFRAFARLPVNFVLCHDDIVNARGPICSPAWMKKYIFPRYEEFFGMVKAAGKEVIFMADGCMDAYVDDVMACGARGIISEPFTNYKAIARKHHNCFIAGEGDNRILMRNNPAEIRAMVESMVATGRMSGGYMMCVGNHIPFNVPPEAVKLYLDLSAELACR